MNRCEKAAVGGLLHDIGKIIYRAGIDKEDHSSSGYKWLSGVIGSDKNADVLDCVRYHHAFRIRNAGIAPDSCAYAVYIADNIAAGADRRERTDNSDKIANEQLFKKDIALSSVFNIMWGKSLEYRYRADNLSEQANYPAKDIAVPGETYSKTAVELKSELGKLFNPDFTCGYINSLLTVLENTLSFVPSSTAVREVADISLYDHCKITAAAASAIVAYLDEKDRSDLHSELLTNEHRFMDEKAFLMFSCDFSGIQQFLYTISSKNALKSLRSRSFFLEVLMEYLMDELLCACGMSRTNVIYTGGGHGYVLLPDTIAVQKALSDFENNVNEWLIAQFQTSLYLACAWTPCSGNDLKNSPADKSPYVNIYRELSRTISQKKLHRYSPEALRQLNSSQSDKDGRECKICGVSAHLVETDDGSVCTWCKRFADISNIIVKGNNEDGITNNVYAVVMDDTPGNEDTHSFPVPDVFGGASRKIVFVAYNEVIELHKYGKALRVYSKNAPHTGLDYATNLYMGDYCANKFVENLAKEAQGIERLCVLRADVDNLGLAFISGFERNGNGLTPAERDRYKTLSRSASFSRQMSLFFKYHINSILAKKDGGMDYSHIFSSSGDGDDGRSAIIVYSGGDDIFAVGAWNDMIDTAIDIHNALLKFTSGALTISAGLSICRYKYPIYMAANDAAGLESASKGLDGKDGITLFTDMGGNTYKWNEFINGVIPKYRKLAAFLDARDAQRGKAFLYRVLELLRGADDKINIARCAYMLARLEPQNNEAKKRAFREFSNSVYGWMTDAAQRGELITAIEVYVYIIRGE